MAQYRLKESVGSSRAQVMYWYGEKEMKCVKELRPYVPAASPILPDLRSERVWARLSVRLSAGGMAEADSAFSGRTVKKVSITTGELYGTAGCCFFDLFFTLIKPEYCPDMSENEVLV